MGIALFGSPVYLRTPRITQPHGTGHLIKSLPSRIIPGTSDDLKLAIILYDHQMCMASGYNQAHKGRLQILIFNKVSRNMAFNVVNTDKRLLSGVCDGLGLCHTYQKSANQAWTVGNADSSNVR